MNASLKKLFMCKKSSNDVDQSNWIIGGGKEERDEKESNN